MKLGERIIMACREKPRGERLAAEVAQLEAELDESLTREAHLQHDMLVVEKENKALRANTRASVLRRIDAQLGVDDEEAE